MKNIIIVLALFWSCLLFAQTQFEQGYFIDENNKKVSCLIKNEDWKSNPTKFKYKQSKNKEVKTHTIDSVKEFAVGTEFKFIQALVKMDRASDNVDRLNHEPRVTLNEVRLFLKVLIEGSYTLYYYEESNLKRFFYQIEEEPIEQLIYKRYLNWDNKILENANFRKQLYEIGPCTAQTKTYDLFYKKKTLTTFFKQINECNKTDFIAYKRKKKGKLVSVFLNVGANLASLSIDREFIDELDLVFTSEKSLRFGMAVEAALPYKNNKWRVFIEPHFQKYTSEVQTEYVDATVEYSVMEIPIGLRHYFYLNDKAQVFVNVSYNPILQFSDNNRIIFSNSINDLKMHGRHNVALGLGFSYRMLSGEVRYYTPRNLMKNAAVWDSSYKKISVILSVKIF